MKLLTKEEAEAHYRTTLEGGLKGFTVGLVSSLALSFFLQRRWPYYHNLPLSLKGLGVVVITAPAAVIQAERQSDAFSRQQWSGAGKMEMDDEEKANLERWENMRFTERAYDYAQRHQFGMVVGGWAAGMVGAGAWVMRDRYMTFPQKIVQVRMWAQGLTIASIIASAVLFSRTPRDQHPDHSWQLMVEEEERLEAIRKQRRAEYAAAHPEEHHNVNHHHRHHEASHEKKDEEKEEDKQEGEKAPAPAK